MIKADENVKFIEIFTINFNFIKLRFYDFIKLNSQSVGWISLIIRLLNSLTYFCRNSYTFMSINSLSFGTDDFIFCIKIFDNENLNLSPNSKKFQKELAKNLLYLILWLWNLLYLSMPNRLISQLFFYFQLWCSSHSLTHLSSLHPHKDCLFIALLLIMT